MAEQIEAALTAALATASAEDQTIIYDLIGELRANLDRRMDQPTARAPLDDWRRLCHHAEALLKRLGVEPYASADI